MKSSVPSRGLQNIHTMTERVNDADNPQRKYLMMGMLELEKARRKKEKLSAGRRIADINQRLADINAEQTELLAAAEAELETSTPAGGQGQAEKPESQSGGGFKLAY